MPPQPLYDSRDQNPACRPRGKLAGVTVGAFFLLSVSLVCRFVFAADDPATDNAPPEPPVTSTDREHWAFRPVIRPGLPAVQNVDWCRTPVDRFILARLEAEKLSPLPEADRATLLRRVTFDLTGLPPTVNELAAFLADDSPEAYERVVDRLLASPAYGERWAQHWLDLARFADTDGFEFDHERPNAWRYRDWVVEALNRDLPFDEFVRLQLAADELHPDDADTLAATGFLLCGPDMPDINNQDERRSTFLNDLTGTVSAALLGLQVGCAQCHDHKYDPISQYDFYRLRAFFDSVDLFKDHPLPGREAPPPSAEVRAGLAKLQASKDNLHALEESARQKLRAENPDLQPTRDDLLSALSTEDRARHEELSKTIATLGKSIKLPDVPRGRIVREKEMDIPPSRLLIRGDFRREGPEVAAGFPRVVTTGYELPSAKAPQSAATGRRTRLAAWLVHEDNPLVPRVIVNRLWQHHFGRGLVETASDYGKMGAEPTHPELLDWLASELISPPLRKGGLGGSPESETTATTPLDATPLGPPFQRGGVTWSMKPFHRLLVTSAVYRQASRPTSPDWNLAEAAAAADSWNRARQTDPDNRLLSHMPRQRLEGEAIRDAMLAISGRLNPQRGGPGVRPPLPAELVSTLLKNQWNVSPNETEHQRRSLYLFVRRNLRYPLFEAFDRPDTNASCARRNRSTIAPQALVLLNSELSLSAARDLAGTLLAHSDSAGGQVREGFRRAFSREPSPFEQRAGEAFLRSQAEKLRAANRPIDELALPSPAPAELATDSAEVYAAAALCDFCLALFNLNEFVYVD